MVKTAANDYALKMNVFCEKPQSSDWTRAGVGEWPVVGKRHGAPLSQGFSMVELMLVIVIIGIITGIAIVAFTNALPGIRADSAMLLLESQLRQGHETAVDQRRSIQVTFSGTGTMTTVEQIVNVATTPPTVTGSTTLGTFVLDPNEMVFTILTGVPDTPDGFGTTGGVLYAVNFTSGVTGDNPCGSPPALPCTITFQGDGTVVDANGNNINGTIFMGTTRDIPTARAVTILGATGRIKGYKWSGTAWF